MRGDGRSKLGCEGPTTTCGARRSTWLPIPPLIEDALFHCQQAAEKAMKAFLTAHDTAFRKTHDLDELAATREESDASLRRRSIPPGTSPSLPGRFAIPARTKRHRRPRRTTPCLWLVELWMPSGNGWGASPEWQIADRKPKVERI